MFQKKHYDLGYLEEILEGKYRPGHFQGVCQVVERLLNIVDPDHLFLGQKDYQQCMVIKKLLQLINSKAQLVIVETVREENGLAMSSRNLRLNNEQKEQAPGIYRILNTIRHDLMPGNLAEIKKRGVDYLVAKGFKVDYVEIADADNLNIMENWNGKSRLVALVAAYINDIRLIDNLLLN